LRGFGRLIFLLDSFDDFPVYAPLQHRQSFVNSNFVSVVFKFCKRKSAHSLPLIAGAPATDTSLVSSYGGIG